ncbi:MULTISPECIES: YkvA family protein [unclassified Psychrobacter]|uniref:YkvA family protein n=1 Tax=unclassified Psychrobacter TaxID=196806 RepID=UPI0025B28304|nr:MULTISPECIES: YkvA family protein [unclassified Psychrobacter]MDN3452898.1 YkvA family protein [Psychrobacter sp. APC 3350]MDN3502080.1 YkvA family protein [Psychrobacter sp. 5A.1]
MFSKTTDKQNKDDILDYDMKYLISKEEKLKEKLKDSSYLERFSKDLMLLMNLIKDYYKGNYRAIPYKTLSAAVVGLLYTLNPIDIIPDFIPFIGHIDDALVLGFCLKLIEKDLKKYQIWKNSQSATTKKTEVKKQA